MLSTLAPACPRGVTGLRSGSCPSWAAQDEALEERRLGDVVASGREVQAEGQGVGTYTVLLARGRWFLLMGILPIDPPSDLGA